MTNKTRQPSQNPLTRDVISLIIILFAVLVFICLPAISNAASIRLQPGSVNVTVNQGETIEITFTAQLAETTSTRSYANFYVAQTGGTLPRDWVSGNNFISLRGNGSSQQASTTLTIPVDAQPKYYTAILQPVGIRSNESLTTTSLSLGVEVAAQAACSEPPAIKVISADEAIITAKSNEPLSFSFSGNISSNDGCTTENAHLILTDEYDELNITQPIELDGSGNFRTSVTVTASRKGKDKNGRLYTIVFGASNEAGDIFGGEQTVTIAHDHRDDHLQEDHASQRGHDRKGNLKRRDITDHR